MKSYPNVEDAEDVRPSGADGAVQFVRRTLYCGPVYRKLYELRQRRPELSYELDDLASSLREMGDRLEEFVREQAESATDEQLPTRDVIGPGRPGHPAL
jgi:hypothetical protein